MKQLTVDQINALSAAAARAQKHRDDHPRLDWLVRRDNFLSEYGFDPTSSDDIKLVDPPKKDEKPSLIRLAYEDYRRANPVPSDEKPRKASSPEYAKAVQAIIEASFED